MPLACRAMAHLKGVIVQTPLYMEHIPEYWAMRVLQHASHPINRQSGCFTANLPTNIVDFRAFDSSTILILRGGILRSIGNFPESLSQAILVGIRLVGRLGGGAFRTMAGYGQFS